MRRETVCSQVHRVVDLFRMNSERWLLMAMINPAARWRRIIALPLLALVVISCAHSEALSSDRDDSEESETVNVVLKEWYVLPEKRSVDAHNITFKISNEGRMDHEFIVIKTTVPVHELPVHERGLDEKKAGKLIGEIEDIHPGETRELTVHMASGNYVLFCNRVEVEDHKIISHYRHGMRVAFSVK
jgi:uncharacterized cupredoxin-like copper-binding protein